VLSVEDIMTMDVISVATTATVKEAQETLVDCGVTGAPMVDAHGRLAGVISQTDLLRHAVSCAADDTATAGSIGTATAVTVGLDASLVSAAGLMAKHRVRRLVVVDGEAIVGVLSAMDIVGAVAQLDPSAFSQLEIPRADRDPTVSG